MANFIVKPTQRATVFSTSTFTGASNVQDSVNTAIIQSTAAYAQSNAAFNQANTVATNLSSNVTLQVGINATQNTNTTNVDTKAQAAFDKANTANVIAQSSYNTANNKVSKSGDTITGNLDIQGQANVTQRLSVGGGGFVLLPNLISQFTGYSDNYSQVNQQNLSGLGSGDFVVTSDNGTDSVNYIDMGITGSVYNNTSFNSMPMAYPNDGYVMLVGNQGQTFGGNVYYGTTGSGTLVGGTRVGDIVFIQGENYNEIARFSMGGGFKLKAEVASSSNSTGTLIVQGGVGVAGAVRADSVYDGSTRISTLAQAAYDQANTVATNLSSNVALQVGINATQNTYTQAAFDRANTDVTNINTTAGTYGNTSYVPVITVAANGRIVSVVNTAISGSGGGGTTDQYARDTANTANVVAQAAFNQANTVTTNLSSNVTLQVGINATQNTNITNVDTKAQAAFNQANNTVTDLSSNVALQVGINATQNTNITNANTKAQAAFDQANTVATNLSSNVTLQVGINATQNTNITNVDTKAQAAFNQANTTVTDLSSNVTLQVGINATQNTNITNANTKAQAAFDKANSANVLAQAAYNTANTGYNFVTGGGTVSGSVTVQNDLTVQGNVNFIGNVTSITVKGNTGQFFGYASNGFNALYAGIPTGYLLEPQITVQISSNYNGYSGLNMQNINSGANSSSDLFITADNGTQLDGYVDLGIGSSTYNYPGYTLIGPNDGYLFAYGNTSTGGGDLIVATGLNNDIIFATRGLNTENEVMRITAANTVVIKTTNTSTSTTTGALQVKGGLGVVGNVYAGAVYSGGSLVLTSEPIGQAAFNQANTDVTNISTTAGTYGSGSLVPVITVAANGRIVSVVNTAISGGSSTTDQYARDTANTANVVAQAAFNQANTTVTNLSSNVALQVGINATQNTNITNVDTKAQAAYDKANSANVLAQAAFDQANTTATNLSSNVTLQVGINATQNTYTQAAFDAANTVATNLSSNVTLQVGINATQNTYTQAAFDQANTTVTNLSSNVALQVGINATQNTNITNVDTKAQAAFNTANTDVTNISTTAGTYGNNKTIPVITVAANGRVTNIVNTSISAVTSLANDSTLSATGTTGDITIGLKTISTITAGQYTYPLLNVDAQGRIVQISNQSAVTSVAGSTGPAISNTALIEGIKTVDGSGSGLDADLLDGNDSTYFSSLTYAQAAYDQANTANVLAQAAFNQANTANVVAQSAYGQANTANVVAQAAFNKANSANVLAQAAFNQANTDVTNINATAGTYGSGSLVPVITVAANGRISSVSTTAVSGGGGAATGNSEIVFVIDGGGSVISTGLRGSLEIPFNCNVVSWTILTDQNGTIGMNVYNENYSTWGSTLPRTNEISFGVPISITSSASKNNYTLITPTAIAASNILSYNVQTVSTITRASICLKVTKT